MKLYHGTKSQFAANSIIVNGMHISRDSKEMFYGAGAYFSTSRAMAGNYGHNVVFAEVPSFPNGFRRLHPSTDAIGTFDQYVNERWKSVRGEIATGIYHNEEQAMSALWKEYLHDGEEMRREQVRAGYIGGYAYQETNIQVIIWDERFLHQLKFHMAEPYVSG